MNNLPVKAFPLQQNNINNQNKRIPSPGGSNQYSKDKYGEQNKKSNQFTDKNNMDDDDNPQMRRSKSSGFLRKSEQNAIVQNNNNAKNRNSEARGSSSSKNGQDSILSSLQNILNNQHSPGQNGSTPGSSHKRTQSTNQTGSGLLSKQQKNNSINGPIGTFSQYQQDQVVKQGQNGSTPVLNKSINKQQQNEFNSDYNNLKSLSSKNIFKPSAGNQNRYTPVSNQNKTGMKGYTSIQNRIESNDRLPKLESLMQQQQQQIQQNNSPSLNQNNGNINQNAFGNKNTKSTQNLLNNGSNLSNSGLFNQGPKININLQIKNLNIIQQNGLRNMNGNQQVMSSDNTPTNYQNGDSPVEQNNGSKLIQHQRNPTQIVNLQQNKGDSDRIVNGTVIKQNLSNSAFLQNNNQQNNKLINSNSSNVLMNGYSGYQQNINNGQNKINLQNNSESRQPSRLGRSNSKDRNDSFSLQPKSNNSQNLAEFLGKSSNIFGKSTSNLNAQGKPQSQSIEPQRRRSKKLNQNSSQQQLQSNINKPNSASAPLKSIVSNYAVRSKPGALPGKPVKTNQDSYIITTNFCKNKNKYFFSVCDGHGVNGHLASQYVKKVLPPNIEFFLKQFCKDELNTPDNILPQENFGGITQSLTSGFLKTASGLLNSGIDITFSGSTCVSVYMTAERYWCANIGDSRAIVGRYDSNTSQWSNQPLSIDHKPDLQSEHDRIISSGGRVEAFKDMDGNPVGPARVWMKHENIPGLAMARSFGDYVASQVGVIPEPEVLYFDINPNDRFLAVASDGIWEFLSNEDVVQMVAPFYFKNDPEGACEKLVREATAAWKREDEVIDDITIIIVFFNKQ